MRVFWFTAFPHDFPALLTVARIFGSSANLNLVELGRTRVISAVTPVARARLHFSPCTDNNTRGCFGGVASQGICYIRLGQRSRSPREGTAPGNHCAKGKANTFWYNSWSWSFWLQPLKKQHVSVIRLHSQTHDTGETRFWEHTDSRVTETLKSIVFRHPSTVPLLSLQHQACFAGVHRRISEGVRTGEHTSSPT